MKNPLPAICLCLGLCALLASGCEASGKNAKKAAPEFPRRSVWLQSEPLTHKMFRGKVTLIYFWDYTSANCLRDLSYIKKWEALYRPYGFQVVLIHAPEFRFAAKRENVKQALEFYKIPFPTLLDNRYEAWEAYKIYSWPTKVLVDGQGNLAHTQVGEGKYLEFETLLRHYLERLSVETVLPEPAMKEEPSTYDEEFCGPMSGETYMGYKRVHWWGGEMANKKWIRPDETSNFRDRGDRVQHGFFLHGLWTNQQDAFEHARDTETVTDYVGVSYFGSRVYSVLAQENPQKETLVYVTRDDEPVPQSMRGSDVREDPDGRTFVLLNASRLYSLIQNEDEAKHEIKLWPTSQGVSVSSFSFANRCLSQVELLSADRA